ncbi:MAG: ribbon-helix-helix domain-containing protein [Pleurocapsa sp.]
MGAIKTTISLDATLLEQTDEQARKTGNSRSGVMAIALQKYLNELRQEEILTQLNDVYQSEESDDLQFVSAAKDYFGNNILDQEEW